jgi:solute carrier family 25 citrate transporter 1
MNGFTCNGLGCFSRYILSCPILGPLSNAPIDTIKTRIQRSSATGSGWERFKIVTSEIMAKEGPRAFYKGLTPRLLRVAPGQAVTFMVYEKVKSWLDVFQEKVKDGEVTALAEK